MIWYSSSDTYKMVPGLSAGGAGPTKAWSLALRDRLAAWGPQSVSPRAAGSASLVLSSQARLASLHGLAQIFVGHFTVACPSVAEPGPAPSAPKLPRESCWGGAGAGGLGQKPERIFAASNRVEFMTRGHRRGAPGSVLVHRGTQRCLRQRRPKIAHIVHLV